MKPRKILYLLINDIHEYNPPYPQSAFTHNPRTSLKCLQQNEFAFPDIGARQKETVL